MKIYKLSAISEETIEKLTNSGWSVISSDIFDNYELYLLEAKKQIRPYLKNYDIPFYQLGIQRKDTDFTDLNQQQKSNPPEDKPPYKSGLNWIKDKLTEWILQYGNLTAMSHSTEKNTKYKKIFERIGLKYKEKDFIGYKILIIIGGNL
jgi:hypothetical protein